MGFRIACPSCQQAYALTDEQRGQTLRCRQCQKQFQVPGRAAPSAIKPPQPRAVAAPPPRPRPPEKETVRERPRRPAKAVPNGSMLPLILVGSAVGVLLLIGGVVGLAVVLWPRTPEPQLVQADVPGKDVQPKKDDKDNKAEKDDKDKGKIDPPKTEDDKKKKDDVKKVVPPEEKLPLPAQLDGPAIQRIKNATVHLRVTLPDGKVAEGSGFFSLEPGIVLTNAHVLGMLQAESRPPTSIDVVLRSGEPDEASLKGTVLGVDRETDLAVVRVTGDAAVLAPPLPVVSATPLVELQKVYIFGFPFGSQLGKNITVAESSISSLRKDKSGTLSQIQVNGGMHPGNSGGPVVNTRGEVIGVAVAGIPGTQINFAVPGDFAQLVGKGRIQETQYGEPFLEGNQRLLPVTIVCLDPLQRIRQLHVEVWTGGDGKPRPAVDQTPPVKAGDDAKKTYTVTFKEGVGKVSIPYSPLRQDQRLWVQPIVTNTAGAKYWALVLPHRPSDAAPLESRPALLVQRFDSTPDRTLTLNMATKVLLIEGKNQAVWSDSAKVVALEQVRSHQLPGSTTKNDGAMKVYFGNVTAEREASGRRISMPPNLVAPLLRLSMSYATDKTGALKERADPNFKALPLSVRDAVEDMYLQSANGYETICFPVPDRQVQPRESWKARQPMLMVAGTKREVVDIFLDCTYEGSRAVEGGGTEAFVRLAGEIKGRDVKKKQTQGKVSGHVVFNVERGFVSEYKLKVTSEIGGGGQGFQAAVTYEVALARVAGNTANVTPPTQPPTPVVKRLKLLTEVVGELNAQSLADAKYRPGARLKVYTMRLAANVTYVIDLKRLEGKLDPYLRLEDEKGTQLAFDDDSGGMLDARLVYRPTQTAVYRVIATSFNPNEFGKFQLKLSEEIP